MNPFEQHLEANPDDWMYRLIYADWLYEHHAIIESEGQRWQIENELHPRKNLENGIFDWWFFDTNSIHTLSADIFKQLRSYSVHKKSRRRKLAFKSYRSMQSAETALAEALSELNIVPSSE